MVKVWMLRPNPHNINRMREFIDNGIVAIGWPELSSLNGRKKGFITSELPKYFPNDTRIQIGIAAGTINRFVNEIRVNDLLIVPNENDVYFCKVVSDYYYEPSKSSEAEGYPHQRKVQWLKGPVRREDIPESVKESLRAPRTLADFSHHIDVILSFIEDDASKELVNISNDDEYITFDYPIRLDKFATIKIPKDIAQNEASRLGDYVKTLYFN